MTDPNSNDPHVPKPPQDPGSQQPNPSQPTPPQPAPPAPEPESTRTEPYDAKSEGGPTVDTEAREVPRQESPPAGDPPQDDSGSSTPPEKAPDDHPWAMACHLAALANLCCPILGLVVTMVIWQMNRANDPEVDWHGKESLNFQLNLIPITLLLGVMILLKDTCFLFGPAILLLPLVYLGAMIYILVASIRAAEGVRYHYPHIKRLLD